MFSDPLSQSPQSPLVVLLRILRKTPFDVSSRASEVVGSANHLGLSPLHFRFVLASGSKSLSSESQSFIPRGNFFLYSLSGTCIEKENTGAARRGWSPLKIGPPGPSMAE